ncbi:MAG: response regulator [Pseudomonadota bacterium]
MESGYELRVAKGETKVPKVLVVEDHKDVSFMVSEALKYHIGCEVITAKDGPECLKIVGDDSPDVILLDIHMPGMDGFQVCKILKEDEATKHIPVIFLTATCCELQNKIKGLEIGADDYLTQPINNLELITRVKVMLRMKKLIDRARTSGEGTGDVKSLTTDFLSMASHELRTPLNSIIGFSELLENEFYGTLTPQQKDFVGLIHENGEKLLKRIDDFIETSKSSIMGQS